MKNIMVIDGANNCNYDIYKVDDIIYSIIFPDFGQDIEFGEDLDSRIAEGSANEMVLKDLYKHRIKKEDVDGIHGILFSDLKHIKSIYYPNKRQSDNENF